MYFRACHVHAALPGLGAALVQHQLEPRHINLEALERGVPELVAHDGGGLQHGGALLGTAGVEPPGRHGTSAWVNF